MTLSMTASERFVHSQPSSDFFSTGNNSKSYYALSSIAVMFVCGVRKTFRHLPWHLCWTQEYCVYTLSRSLRGGNTGEMTRFLGSLVNWTKEVSRLNSIRFSDIMVSCRMPIWLHRVHGFIEIKLPWIWASLRELRHCIAWQGIVTAGNEWHEFRERGKVETSNIVSQSGGCIHRIPSTFRKSQKEVVKMFVDLRAFR